MRCLIKLGGCKGSSGRRWERVRCIKKRTLLLDNNLSLVLNNTECIKKGGGGGGDEQNPMEGRLNVTGTWKVNILFREDVTNVQSLCGNNNFR